MRNRRCFTTRKRRSSRVVMEESSLVIETHQRRSKKKSPWEILFNQLQLAACWITESLKIENAAIAKTFTITKLSFAIKVRDFSWNRFFEHQNSNYSDVALFLTSETTVKESRRKVINQKKSDSCFYCSHIPWWFA